MSPEPESAPSEPSASSTTAAPEVSPNSVTAYTVEDAKELGMARPTSSESIPEPIAEAEAVDDISAKNLRVEVHTEMNGVWAPRNVVLMAGQWLNATHACGAHGGSDYTFLRTTSLCDSEQPHNTKFVLLEIV